MPRVPGITKREDLAPVHRRFYDQIAESRGYVGGPFTVLLHSPDAAARAANLGAYVRFESTLPERVHALVALIVGREYDCVFEWTVNEEGARHAGVPLQAINAIRDRKAPAGLDAGDALVFAFGTELMRKHRVSPQTWQAAMDRFGLRAVTDLCVAFGYYAFLTFPLNAFEVDPGPEHPSTLPV